MSLSDQQFAFSKDLALLLQFIFSKGWKVTVGEVWRPDEMQLLYLDEGKTQVDRSLHQDKMAVDLNFFIPLEDGGYEYIGNKPPSSQKIAVQQFGDFWESLSDRNQWGGNWDQFLDVPHFQKDKI